MPRRVRGCVETVITLLHTHTHTRHTHTQFLGFTPSVASASKQTVLCKTPLDRNTHRKTRDREKEEGERKRERR